MHVEQRAGRKTRDIRQCQIVRAHQADGPAPEQRPDHALGADAPIGGVRALQQFIHEEQQRQFIGLE